MHNIWETCTFQPQMIGIIDLTNEWLRKIDPSKHGHLLNPSSKLVLPKENQTSGLVPNVIVLTRFEMKIIGINMRLPKNTPLIVLDANGSHHLVRVAPILREGIGPGWWTTVCYLKAPRGHVSRETFQGLPLASDLEMSSTVAPAS
jgi:hypothetical protein